jgi:hypothetical protein
VEVGEVRDAQAVELRGESGELDLEHATAKPPGLEPAPESERRPHDER